MKSIGEVLTKAREKQNLSRSDIAGRTFIKEEYIEALEENEFHRLPSPAAAQGFLQTYAHLVGLDTTSAIAMLRRDFEIYNDTYVPVLSVKHPKDSKRRTALIRVIGIGLLATGIVGSYGLWSYRRLTQPPELTIISPDSGDSVVSPVVVRGVTDSDAAVSVDRIPVGITQDGEFAGELELTKGEHTITVTAKNRGGSETLKQITVTVEK